MTADREKRPLVVEALSWGFRQRSLGSALDFSLAPGEAIAIVGPNGAGKTTLLGTLSGQRRPLGGRVLLGGQALDTLAITERAKRVAVLPQAAALDLDLTVRELVELGRTPHLGRWGHLRREDVDAVDQALLACDLERLADRRLLQISGGERQRAQIALCIAQAAPLLLLDEPTTHLDIRRRHDLFELIARLRKEARLAFLLVLHDLAEAFAEADRVLVLCGDRWLELAHDDDARVEKLAAAFDVPAERIVI